MAGPSVSRGWRWIAAGLIALLVAVVLGGYLYERHRTGSIYHPHARFIPQPSPTLPVRGPARYAWPFYGYSPEHTRFFPAPARVFPPFKRLWVRNGGSLLEFPPSLYGDHIFQLADDGVLSAINIHTGHTFWQRRLGIARPHRRLRPWATSCTRPCSRARPASTRARVVALAYATGRTLWSRALPSPSESSPLRGSRPRLLRLPERHRLRTERPQRRRRSGSTTPAAPSRPARHSPTGSSTSATTPATSRPLDERTGRRIWDSGSGGALLGSGTFYSTVAVMYGRVFLGNTDGRVYAYDAFTGQLDWAVQTGAYVYASPAVVNAPGLGPTVYVGSYDGTFYALNARSGQIEWQFHPGGRISGSATIVGRVVYFADLAEPPHLRPRHLHRAGRVPDAHRLLRPGDQRRAGHLPDRLHRPVWPGPHQVSP